MAGNYPFLDRVRASLENQKGDKKKTLRWLATQIDKSERWFYNITDFNKLAIGDVEKISSLLEKNFMADYNHWRLENEQESLTIVSEPETEWKREVKKVHIQLKLSATSLVAEENLSKMFAVVRREGEKLGFDIE